MSQIYLYRNPLFLTKIACIVVDECCSDYRSCWFVCDIDESHVPLCMPISSYAYAKTKEESLNKSLQSVYINICTSYYTQLEILPITYLIWTPYCKYIIERVIQMLRFPLVYSIDNIFVPWDDWNNIHPAFDPPAFVDRNHWVPRMR